MKYLSALLGLAAMFLLGACANPTAQAAHQSQGSGVLGADASTFPAVYGLPARFWGEETYTIGASQLKIDESGRVTTLQVSNDNVTGAVAIADLCRPFFPANARLVGPVAPGQWAYTSDAGTFVLSVMPAACALSMT